MYRLLWLWLFQPVGILLLLSATLPPYRSSPAAWLIQPVSSLVLLTPPASHYGFYDDVRDELFDFYIDFYRAATSVGERVILVADQRAPRNSVDLGAMAELLARSTNDGMIIVREQDFIVDFPLDDIWVRDFFPTQLGDDHVARFAFAPAYLDADTVYYINFSTEDLLDYWNLPNLTYYDDIVMDGGGIVFTTPSSSGTNHSANNNATSSSSTAISSMAVVTERVLRDNPALAGRNDSFGLGPSDFCCLADPYGILVDDYDERGDGVINTSTSFTAEEIAMGERALEGALGFDKVAIVPEEPGVPRLGHIDGIANWLADDVLALSNYSYPMMYQNYKEQLLNKFGNDNITIVALPYAPAVNETFSDGFESAVGIYVNFLRTKMAIYMPIFDIHPHDEIALEIAQNYSRDLPVVAVNASQVAIMGGSVRCLSQHYWGEPAKVIAGGDGNDDDALESMNAASKTSLP